MSKTNPNVPELYKYADVSTSHISLSDKEILEENSDPSNDSFPLTVAEYKYGFFIPLPDRSVVLKDPDFGFQNTLKMLGISDAFCKLIEHCVECKAVVLRLDVDGGVIEGLETFDW